jgi:phage terminase large subunit-like protein
MANPYHHSVSSSKKWGGTPEDYQKIHDWFDESKMMMADFRHRALRHHAEGIFMCERIFGHTIILSNGKKILLTLVLMVYIQNLKEDQNL